MTELSLFSGAGGGVLGTKLLGWRCIGYVEYNDYCQRVIAQRIRDGIFDDAPIFGDIKAFIGEGYAASYQGVVDVITAGWPCPPVSVAGKREGHDDQRWLWPEVVRCIRKIRPRYFFGENVPGLLSANAGREFNEVLTDLAESGYDCRWRCLSAAELGAPHRRDRLWIVAESSEFGSGRRDNGYGSRREIQAPGSGGREKPEVLADTVNNGFFAAKIRKGYGGNSQKDETRENNGSKPEGSNCASKNVADSASQRKREPADKAVADCGNAWDEPGRSSWWETEPGLDRVVDGCPDWANRLKAIGNMQVPAVAAKAWRLLND